MYALPHIIILNLVLLIASTLLAMPHSIPASMLYNILLFSASNAVLFSLGKKFASICWSASKTQLWPLYGKIHHCEHESLLKSGFKKDVLLIMMLAAGIFIWIVVRASLRLFVASQYLGFELEPVVSAFAGFINLFVNLALQFVRGMILLVLLISLVFGHRE